jgi:hypothetical protein
MKDFSQLTIRLSGALREQLVARADLQHRSLNAEINLLLERAVDGTADRMREISSSVPRTT